ncbi:DUF742 domain-containing protein [Kibdelosporangium philippinense]|uniref:DUF742 domain-containing protein n=1 Tax=Kibdelosporangium philippinense TaxID=211113 RepID=UPI003611BD1B
MAGSDRRKNEVGRTGARFGHVPAVGGHAEEEWGEPAVPTAKPGTGPAGARFQRADAPPPPPLPTLPPADIPQQQGGWLPEPEPEWTEVDRTRSIVRPYAWTGGRTETAYDLPIEALISTNRTTLARIGSTMTHDHRSVADLCLSARSVAEVAALLSLPLGVARVVLGDMASASMVVVHRPKSANGERPDLSLMERVLTGLRNL